MMRLVMIFLGGGLGSVLRYLVTGWVSRLDGSSFPTGTLVVNITGCMAIGFLASLWTGPQMIREEYRLAVLIGVLGGFTTFSTFGWETFSLANDRQFLLATLNVLISNGAGLFAAWLGSRVAIAIYGV